MTLFFSDVEGSTALLHELGAEKYAGALAQHRALLRKEFARYGGYEAGCEGDSFFVAFPSADAAVEAAAAAQRALGDANWPGDLPLRVRIGLHTGEPLLVGDNYVGVDVHQAARIMSAGHGGQVLLSEATAAFVEGHNVLDLGTHELKDFARPIRLFQLESTVLGTRFPPPRTLQSRPTNLPRSLTPLIGRTVERSEVAARLQQGVRLVTLTGAGGIGKTRLALEIAADHREVFTDGVYFVDLSPITDADLVVPTIAQAIGINEGAGQSLIPYLQRRRVLVVADNFEQVLSGASQIGALLAQAPGLTVLATCRAPLRLHGEHVYPLNPLPTPSLGEGIEPTTLERFDAAMLFVERARQVDPSFRVDAENAPDVAAICVQLDGLPLAIELAATRVSLLQPRELLARLDSRLALLTDGPRDLPSRHQTLRGTLAWSYDLLDRAEQQLFAQLGVFSGGFSLEAVEQVTGAPLSQLAALVEASLVRRQDDRFTLFETMREYAVERLASLALEADTRQRHARYFEAQALAVEMAADNRELDRVALMQRLKPDLDNFRTALDELTPAPARRLRMLVALSWLMDSTPAEGQARLAAALEATEARDVVRVRALGLLTRFAGERGEIDVAARAADEAVALARELDELQALLAVLDRLRWAYIVAGDDRSAHAATDQQVAVARESEDLGALASAEWSLLHVLIQEHDLEAFDELAPQALEHARRAPGFDLASFEILHERLVAEADLIRGKPEHAASGFQGRLRLLAPFDARTQMAFEVEGIAMAMAGTGRDELALQLAGAARAEFDACGFVLDKLRMWPQLKASYLEPARARLGNEPADRAWNLGAATPFDEAVAIALAAPSTPK